MAAIKMEDLEHREMKLGLQPGELSYQLRCSRVVALEKGEPWQMPKAEDLKRGTIESASTRSNTIPLEQHPLFNKRILISPMMTFDKNRNIYFEEPIGHDIEVEEVSAGKMLYGAAEDVDRMAADYKIIRENPDKVITAKTTLPKSGQEISWNIGKELVPVVRGNDKQRGYCWILPTHVRQYTDPETGIVTDIQIMGLKTLILQIAPELLPRFSGKPVMMWVDGFVCAASIPQTEAILKEWRRKEMQDARLGF
jgi:hypothetical protein